MVSLLHETSLCACFTAGITSGSIRRGCIRSPRSQGSRLPSFACILGELLLLCSGPYRVIHCPRLSLLHPPKSFHKMVRSQPNNPTTSPPPTHYQSAGVVFAIKRRASFTENITFSSCCRFPCAGMKKLPRMECHLYPP